MNFLKNVLKERYDEFAGMIEDYNRDNPDKAVKLANLSEGGYVDKEKYNSQKVKFEKEIARINAEFAQSNKNFALDLAIKGEKPRNAKAVRALLDLDAISFENGELIGFSEQIASVRKENSFLFETEGKPQFSGSFSGGEPAITKEEFKNMSYLDKLRFKKEAPELYNQFK